MKRNFLWLTVFLFLSAGLIIRFVFLYNSHHTVEVIGNNISSKYFKTSAPVSFRDSGQSIEFEYSDSFFIRPSTSYNHQLAQSSIGMAVSSFSSTNSDKFWGDTGHFGRDTDIIEFFKSLGFENIKTYNYDKSLNDTSDTVAFAIGEKEIKLNDNLFRLVALSIRGGGYGNEWVSNFNLGNTEVHKGFLLASDDVIKNLYMYLGENTENTKLWITGYSRGGAVANITAARLTDDRKVRLENIFAYTFAAPRGTVSKSADKYENIFNIVSENDLVPFIAPSKWGYQRYGKDMYFPSLSELNPSVASELSQNINEVYKSISKNGDFNLLKIEESNQKHKLRTFIDEICSSLTSRISYTDKYDRIFMDFIECNNTKIKFENGKWKWVSAYEGFTNKYANKQNFLQLAKNVPFLKNAEKILGSAGEKIIVLGAICLVHGENPYKVIVNEIGIDNLSIIASVLSGTSDDGFAFTKIHSAESYTAQLLSITSPSLMR